MLYASDYFGSLIDQEGGFALKLGQKLWLGDSTVYFVVNSSGALEIVSTSIAITGTFTLGPIDIAAGTQVASNPILDATATWNAGAVAFEAFKINITDTASDATSTLISLQVASAAKFAVTKAGAGTFASTLTCTTIDATGGTITANDPGINITQTWNAGAVAFKGIFQNITNTASAATARLIDLQVGGASKFDMDVSGNITTLAGKIKSYAGAAPTNGQVLMGHTANATFEIGTLTGTANQITVTGGAGSVTFSTPQDINTTSSPTFKKMSLTQGALTDPSAALAVTSTWNDAADTMLGITLDVTNTASAAASKLLDLMVGSATKFSVGVGGNIATAGKISSYAGAAPTDGQVLMGHTANGTLEIGTLTGTANQITVTGGAGSVTFSTPQNIHSAATPTFASMTLTKGAITDPAAVLGGTVTWNDGADTFTGISLVVTDTASAAASMFLDFQTGAGSKFSVLKSGNMNCGTIGITGGTVVADDPVIEADQTWNNAGVTFQGIDLDIVNTASAATSLLMNLKVSTATKFSVGVGGNLSTAGKLVLYGGAAPTDGQVLMGHTANGAFEVGTLTGTANQVTVTGGAGSVTFSTPQNIHSAATPTFGALTLTQGAITDPAYNLNSTVTWNDAADTFTAWFLNVTSTASAAGSLLVDLQVGGASKFAIGKAGDVKMYAGAAPTDGQILIGHTANANFAAATLTGTANQVTVTGGAGSITLSTPQSIHTGAMPTFADLTLTQGAITDPKANLSGTVTWNDGADTMAGWSLSVTDTASAAASLLLNLLVGGGTKFSVRKDGGITTAGKIIGYGGAALTDGQVLIGATATGDLTAATLTGTANQVTVTNAGGSITLSTPQSIATTSTPTFGSLTLTQGAITDPAYNVNSTVTWNDGADTFTAWFLNVTNTASAAASKLIDLQVGGATQFNVNRSGDVTAIGTGTFNKVAMGDAKILAFGTSDDVTLAYDGTDNVLDVALGNAGLSFNLSSTASATCTEGRALQVNSTTFANAGVDTVDCGGICRVGAAPAGTATAAVSGFCFATADAIVGMNRPLKSCSGGRLGEMIDSTNVSGTIFITAIGSAFTNQPANDSITFVSDAAGDTQNLTMYGTTNGTDTVVVETKAVNGLVPVVSDKLDWGEMVGFELSSAAVGTITIKETSGGLTITTIIPTGTQSGVQTVTAGAVRRAFNGIPTVVADGATTKQVAVVGTNTDYTALTNCSVNLNGAAKVSLPTAMNEVTKVLMGDVENTRTVTIQVRATEDNSELRIAQSLGTAAAKDDSIRVGVMKGI